MLPPVAIFFLFALGACVGSFLNVVVWRLPRIKVPPDASLLHELWLTLRGLSTPPSHCPKCDTRLSWRDNIPIFGWLLLGGRCRYCRAPIAKRYPTVELATAMLFAGTYVLLYFADLGPCAPSVTSVNQYGIETTVAGGLNPLRDGWLLWLYLPLIGCLLAASLIDFELLIIPIWIPWLLLVIGLSVHGIHDRPGLPGNLIQTPTATLMSVGATVGLILSLMMMRVGVLKRSFLEGEPMTKAEQDAVIAGTGPVVLDYEALPLKDYSPAEVRREMRLEVLFLVPPIVLAAVLGILAMKVNAFANVGSTLASTPHLNGILGALLGAHIGALVVWATRILGSVGFGREAMGMGDVHLMFGVGAVLGGGMSAVAFFLSPLPALLIHLYLVFTDPKRAVPFGPYLSFASIGVIFVYCPIAAYLGPGMVGLGILLRQAVGLD